MSQQKKVSKNCHRVPQKKCEKRHQKPPVVSVVNHSIDKQLKIIESFSKVDQNQQFIQEQVVSLKEKPYQLVQVYSAIENPVCFAIAFNQQSTIMVAGCSSRIIVFDFQEGQMTEKQILSSHKFTIDTLYFMTKLNQFISGAGCGEIGLWCFNNTTEKYELLQMLRGAHQDNVYRVIMNKNEDLIISCSTDKTIKFWIRRNNELECLQTHNFMSWVHPISSVWKFYDNNILIRIQRIQVYMFGFRICYINDSLIAYQPYSNQNLEFYSLNQNNKQFVKLKDVRVNSNGLCKEHFPMQFNINKQLLLHKNCHCINFIRKQNDEFIVEQSIDFEVSASFGKMTDDFKYLVTWDAKSKVFQVRKQI